jgi:hypothetical protein
LTNCGKNWDLKVFDQAEQNGNGKSRKKLFISASIYGMIPGDLMETLLRQRDKNNHKFIFEKSLHS